MTDYDTPKLPTRVRTLTRNCDHKITLERLDSLPTEDNPGNPIDWPGGAEIYVLIDINSKVPERVDGVIDGSLVTMRIESEIADQCIDGTTYRIVISTAEGSDPSFETPLRLGYFERNDGE